MNAQPQAQRVLPPRRIRIGYLKSQLASYREARREAQSFARDFAASGREVIPSQKPGGFLVYDTHSGFPWAVIEVCAQ